MENSPKRCRSDCTPRPLLRSLARQARACTRETNSLRRRPSSWQRPSPDARRPRFM